MDLGVIFFTGLTVGGVTCMAVQGGLLASIITARESEDLENNQQKKHTTWPLVVFLATKLLVYLLFGFVLGAFGGALSLSDGARTLMQLAAGLYMIAVALDLLKVHPIFRYAVIQPPRFLVKKLRDASKSKDIFAPAFLGALTIFIPCGTTLAMEALAISSGSALKGALILGTFVLGTTPLFFGLGWITTVLGDALREKFFKVAAIAVLYLGLSSVNSSLVVMGSPITWNSLREAIPIEINLGDAEDGNASVKVVDGVSVADIKVFPNAYVPNVVQVKAGMPIRLNLTTTGGYGCSSAFTIPSLGVRKSLPKNTTTTIDLSAQNPGKITFTCSMGMYSGTIEVVE